MHTRIQTGLCVTAADRASLLVLTLNDADALDVRLPTEASLFLLFKSFVSNQHEGITKIDPCCGLASFLLDYHLSTQFSNTTSLPSSL